MKANTKRTLAGLSGMLMIQSGVTAQAAVDGVSLTQTEQQTYDEVANVQGAFAFDQDVISPRDDIFNLFGTAATGVCATPGFVFAQQDGASDYYLNVGGKLKKSFTVSYSDLENNSRAEVMKCSCGMSSAVANAAITGVPMEKIVEMADLEDDVNAVAFKGADGYTVSVSLDKIKGAMLVYKVNGKNTVAEEGGPVQLWMPGAAASYFTRNVTDVEFIHADDIAGMAAPAAEQRAKVNFVNHFEKSAFHVGDQISFEGYADDFDTSIAAVQFSMDGGKTWTTCETNGATPDKWVYWNFTYTAAQPGSYKLDARALTANGNVSPLAASVVFEVE